MSPNTKIYVEFVSRLLKNDDTNIHESTLFAEKFSKLITNMLVANPSAQHFVKDSRSQQCPLDALMYILDKFNDKGITNLFSMAVRSATQCMSCNFVGPQIRVPMCLDIFYYENTVSTEDEFMRVLMKPDNQVDDWKCDNCGHGGVIATNKRTRTMVREIITCVFNTFQDRSQRYAPDEFSIRMNGDITVRYKKVAVVDHHGSDANSGHYTCRGLRGDGKYYLFNDAYVEEVENLDSKSGTFIVFYNAYAVVPN
jgi:uncharacterized UBP type Zn finger protein